ncbi:hypothetical protein RUND412_007229 [Rhizina undulata]
MIFPKRLFTLILITVNGFAIITNSLEIVRNEIIQRSPEEAVAQQRIKTIQQNITLAVTTTETRLLTTTSTATVTETCRSKANCGLYQTGTLTFDDIPASTPPPKPYNSFTFLGIVDWIVVSPFSIRGLNLTSNALLSSSRGWISFTSGSPAEFTFDIVAIRVAAPGSNRDSADVRIYMTGYRLDKSRVPDVVIEMGGIEGGLKKVELDRRLDGLVWFSIAAFAVDKNGVRSPVDLVVDDVGFVKRGLC